eukprot:gene29481-33131_t
MSDDAVFRALADASRRQLLDRLHAENGQTLGDLCQGLDMSRQAVAKHLAILEEANLVSTRRHGREKLHFINPVPINEIAERWIGNTADQSSFVYVTYIRTTPEKLWTALTDQEIVPTYWFGVHHETDWKPGSSWKLIYPDGRVTDTGEILEIDPPRRVVIKWRNEFLPDLKAEGYGRCTIELEPLDGAVKLTIAHVMDRPDSKYIRAVSGGWPKILSNLKSLLETGELAMPV